MVQEGHGTTQDPENGQEKVTKTEKTQYYDKKLKNLSQKKDKETPTIERRLSKIDDATINTIFRSRIKSLGCPS